MAEKKVIKKPVEKKEPVKKAVKSEPVAKAAEPIKETPVAKAAEPVKEKPAAKAAEPVKEKPVVKAAEVVKEKAAEVKEAVKEKTAAVKKAEPVSEEIYVQFGNNEFFTKDIVEKVKAAYVAEGHKAESIKQVRVYIKPEEGMVYYVVNNDYASGISLY